MSTTTTYQGYDGAGKPSSRVLNPPGGGSSNIFGFGGDDNPPPQRRQQAAAAGQPSQPPPAQNNEPPQRARGPKAAVNPITGEPLYQQNQAKAGGPAAQGGGDSEPAESASPEDASAGQPAQSQKPTDSMNSLMTAGRPTNEVPSTRVMQPPGGRSTKLW